MALIETFEIFSSCRTRISIQFSQLSNWGTFFSRCRWCFSFLATKIRNTRSWMHVSRSQHRANQHFSDELGGLGDEPARINKKKGKIEKYTYIIDTRENRKIAEKSTWEDCILFSHRRLDVLTAQLNLEIKVNRFKCGLK